MDFYQIIVKNVKKGKFEIFADYNTLRPKDLMIRGKSFFAVWDETTGLWSMDDGLVIEMIDRDLYSAYTKLRKEEPDADISVKYLKRNSTGGMKEFRRYIINQSDHYQQLDNELTFQNTVTKLEDYASKKLPYSLAPGSIEAYDKIISTLYEPSERRKLEWAIGAIVAGEAKYIEKFIVIYGAPGSGKGTILKIIQRLFPNYYTMFDAKSIVSNNNSFATEVFKSNPLVAIQQDGDLSKIEDNTRLNSIVSHEEMLMNEKYKSSYIAKVNSFLFMGTNSNVKITETKSGIIRRLINVVPSGKLVPNEEYKKLEQQIEFELGAIAYHCLQVFTGMGASFYDGYRPRDMILRTNHFYNFINDTVDEFIKNDGVSLSRAYALYKEWCDDAKVDHPFQKFKFRDELKNYFKQFDEVTRPPSEEGRQVRNWYSKFDNDKFNNPDPSVLVEDKRDDVPGTDWGWMKMDSDTSILDSLLADCQAQYSNVEGTPFESWDKVEKTLSQINTTKEHFVRPPLEHIVIDFDLKDESGEKSQEMNMSAASNWPKTYAELSRSGKAVHLHYIYDGDPTLLSADYSPGIEIKVFKGKSSLRRKLTKCNNIEIAHISSGLPLSKGGNKVVNPDIVHTEKSLRTMIEKNLRKEIHSSTKSSIDFIHKILEDAYNGGLKYDVTDLRQKVLIFASKSTNQSEYCLKLVNKMRFKTEDEVDIVDSPSYKTDTIIFFDVEVFPNLFVVCYKEQGEDKQCVKLINPTPTQIESLIKFKLVGFNNRRYDNHILYAAYLGKTPQELYRFSKSIIDNDNPFNGLQEATNLSYTDVYCFSTKKQSLKKWEIELGIHHQELGLPWDDPVSEDLWEKVADYCCNDVIATEKVWDHLAGDWLARQILAQLSGLTVNDTTNTHTAKIILMGDKNAKNKFVYTDLSEMFPGYKYEFGKSTYRGEEVGEGGYVYGQPGVYGNVALLDVQSMHPASAIAMNMFGPYTQRFKDLRDVRVAIKLGDYDTARHLFDGKLAPYLEDKDSASALSFALKIAINSVYGLTAARFDSKFRDPRNIDNICAKRGSLFMVDLKHAVTEQGYSVVHIKTDSIKIADADQFIIDFVKEFGNKYGYIFEHEATYDKLCLVNNSTYVCKTVDGKWESTGTQFIRPYVFKTLFSKEPITIDDMTESRSVKTALYLDFNEGLSEEEHNYHFIGKDGAFCPVLPGKGGGILVRKKDDKYDAVGGTKGYRWLETEMVKKIGSLDIIDVQYYRNFVDEARNDISKFCDIEWFLSDVPFNKDHNGILPF